MKFYIVRSSDGCHAVVYADVLSVGERVQGKIYQMEDAIGDWRSVEGPDYVVVDVVNSISNINNPEDPFDRDDSWTMSHIQERIKDDPELVEMFLQLATAFYERGRESTMEEVARRVHDAIYRLR